MIRQKQIGFALLILLVAAVFVTAVYIFEKHRDRSAGFFPRTVEEKSADEENLRVSEPLPRPPPAPKAVLSGGTIVASVPMEVPSSVIDPVVKVKETTVKITVQETLKKIPCANGEAFSSCYEAFYRKMVLNEGASVAFVDLKKRYESDSFAKSECHQLTHAIGRASVMKYPDISEAYTRGDSFCWSGYYHGVVEAFIQKIGKDNLAEGKGINDICWPFHEKHPYSFDHYNCAHGIGHGLMYIHSNELFDSLKICDKVADLWERSSCFGGVFMENIMVDNKNHFTKYLKPEDPLYPCDAVDESYKGQCYLMQTSYMLRVKNGNFSDVFSLCSGVPAPNNIICYQSLGRDASGRTLSDPVRTTEYCLLGHNETEQSNCVIGAVKDFISYFHSDVLGKKFCAGLPSNLSDVCFSTAREYYKNF